jgi:HEAT repeat protein
MAAQWLPSQSLMRYVYEAAESDNVYVAVHACACLTRLKAANYEQEVVTLLFRFPDQIAYITAELSQAGATEILQLMEPFIDDMPADMATHFLALADFSKDKNLMPLLIRRLAITDEGREIAIIVRNIGRLGDSSHLKLIRSFVNHEFDYVRIQALKSVGKLGNEEDVDLILPLLSDKEWWVRYRAARALINLLKQDSDAIQTLLNQLTDKFAKDIITHVFTEIKWCLR